MAVPSIVANVTTPLLGLIDTAIVGHMGDAAYIGAIAVGGVMFNMLYWLFSFLRAGTSGLSAQAYGASDRDESALVLYRSLLVALCAGVGMVAFAVACIVVVEGVCRSRPCDGCPCFGLFRDIDLRRTGGVGTYALSGWFLGMQNSRMLMVTSIVINLSNIAVSLLLVYGLGWKIPGVAVGTLVAQWLGFSQVCGCFVVTGFNVRSGAR